MSFAIALTGTVGGKKITGDNSFGNDLFMLRAHCGRFSYGPQSECPLYIGIKNFNTKLIGDGSVQIGRDSIKLDCPKPEKRDIDDEITRTKNLFHNYQQTVCNHCNQGGR
ncbi:MAG: hypothetical protein FWG80_00490 [Alphaproteobacteria bacterium]|nr:hypothetical protein [Alphaproteobacteria bacterium]